MKHTAVLDGGSRGHHHSSADGIQRIRDDTSRHSDGITQNKGQDHGTILADQDRLEGVIETKIETSVHDDADGRDDETTVKTGDTIGGGSLLQAVEHSRELTLNDGTILLDGLGIVSQTSTNVIQRINEAQRQRTGGTTRGDVLGEGNSVRIGLLGVEDLLDGVLESEVQGLSGEITKAVSQVSSPQGLNTFIGHGALEAVTNAIVRSSQTS